MLVCLLIESSLPQQPVATRTLVVTLHKPDEVSWEEFRSTMGEECYPTWGKHALIQCFMEAFALTHSS